MPYYGLFVIERHSELQYSIFALHSVLSSVSLKVSHLFQNLVMFLSLLVAWVIPDVPKTIMEQLKREKKLLVEVFLQEEKEKIQLIQSFFSKNPSHAPPQAPVIPGRYSTLPPGMTQSSDRQGEGQRVRCRAASFSQFSRNVSSPARSETENSRQTLV